MQALSIKKAVKISYKGETKRLKLSGAYQELISRTRAAFKNIPTEFKFFYLDEDNEIISISSQSDYTEALEIEDLASLRLTVAQTAQDARLQLLSQLEDARPLCESINSSQIMSQHALGPARTMRDNFMGESDFDSVSHAELAHSIFDLARHQTMPSHEMACGSDDAMVDAGTDTKPRAEAGCNTQRVQTSEKMIDTTVPMQDMSSQAHTQVRDMGCDGIITTMQNQASQMMSEMKDVDITCDLLIPSEDEDTVDVEEVTCIKCNGTQMNKKGLPCRKCNGRGTLVSRELSAISAMVRQEVQEYCYQSFRQMFTDYLVDKQIKQDATVHDKTICDGCEANPIQGIRFMCSVCSDTDFCQKCEKSGVHSQHPLLKIRKQAQAPTKLICQYKNPEMQVKTQAQCPSPSPSQSQSPAQSDVHPWERHADNARNNTRDSTARYSARFVKESFPDKTKIESGSVFCKSWWMRNDGEVAWPAGTKLIQTSGDDLSAGVVELKEEVATGTTFEFSVKCKAPELVGQYGAHFRLQTGRIKFGHKLNILIVVVEPMPDLEKDKMDADLNSILSGPTNELIGVPQMMAQDLIVEATDKEMAEPHPIYQETAQPDQVMAEESAFQPSVLMQSTISIEAKSPKQIYLERIEAETDQTLGYALKALYEFGFTNYAVNKMLMLKHNDVNVVAEQLMTGALSESQFSNIVDQ